MKKRLYNRIIAFIMCIFLAMDSGTLMAYAQETDIEGEIDLLQEIDDDIEIETEEAAWTDDEEIPEEAGLSLTLDKKYGIIATGNCGVKSGDNYADNLTYELYRASDDTLTLTISGSGEMGENCYSIWKSLYTEIKEGNWNLVLNEGITSIGNYAFGGPSSKDLCTYVFKGTLDIPDSVTSIGLRAFYSLPNLTGELVIPEYVESIEAEAFAGCTGFAALPMSIPESVKIIGARAFYNCKFPSYYLPESIILLGNSSDSETFPFPTKIGTTPVILIVLKETYAYTWADENRKYGYEVEIGQRKYRIYYDVNCSDGTVDPKIGILYEERQLGELAVPIRPGYTFLGWFTDPTDGDIIKSDDICYGPIQAYAHWSQNDYDVAFDAQGGKGNTESRTVTYDEVYGPLPAVTRVNYDFTGWYTDPEEGTLIDETSPVKIPENHTLYAHWLGTPMTVHFDKLDGEGTADDITVYFDSKYGTLPVPTKEHCTFLGWYTQRSGGDEVTKDTVVTALSDHTLYAHWEGVKMKVYFEANGGTGFLPSVEVMYGSTYGENGNLPIVSRDDKDFSGWYTELEGGEKVTEDTIVTQITHHNLYAHWEPKHVKVSFNANGGSSIHPAVTVLCESPYGELPVPTNYGYDFTGWYTSGIGGFLVTKDTIVESHINHTLFAHWTPKTGIKVSFDASSGSVIADDLFVTYNSSYAKGSSLPIPTRESYEFAGWYTEEDGGKRVDPDTLVTIEDDHVLHARWRGKPFIITFETGETAGMRDTKTVYYDDYYGGLPTPAKYGSKFEGWYTSQIDGEKIEPTTKVLITEDQKLYAHWSNKICVVSYELDGGTNDSRNPVTYTMSANTIKLYDPYKLGYKFSGWYVGPKKQAKEKITQISRGMAEDITLYAKWTVNKYKISYVMGISATNPNASKTTYRVCDHNTALTRYAFKAPSKKGYVFEGWYLDPEFTEPIQYIDGTFEGNIKVYAKWRGATYYLRYNADDAIAGAVTPTMHQYMNPDSTVSLGEGFIKEGYHVKRWYLKESLSGKFINAGTNNNNICTEENEIVDVYAYFVPNYYYVVYDGNDATRGKMGKKKFMFGKEAGISNCSYRKTGYMFDSWNTEPDGSGSTLKPGQKVTGLTTYNEETVTLYAQWKPISYTIDFAPGTNGKGKMNSIKATYDEATLIPANAFIREGFTFKNWKLNRRINRVYPEYEAGETAVLNAYSADGGVVTLKAIWQYTISFDPNCSDSTGYMDNVTFEADKRNRLPENEYKRDGYTFMGWALTPDARTRKYVNNATVNNLGNITLYAVWKAK